MKITITDIILIVLIFSVLYLLYSPDIDSFTNETDINTAIDEEINNRYSVDLTNMRNLSKLITDITNNQDALNITQSNTKLFDINTINMNINGGLNVSDVSYFNNEVLVQGTVVPPVDKLKFKNTNITNNIKINQGAFNDIFPKESILLFNIKDTNYNIPYGWVPCDGSYYDVIQTNANNLGIDENGYYAKFYKKSDNQPEIRNIDLAYEIQTFIPTIEQLVKLRDISIDKYRLITGVNTEPFTENELERINYWDMGGISQEIAKSGNWDRTPRKGLSNDPIKRDYIYIRKIL